MMNDRKNSGGNSRILSFFEKYLSFHKTRGGRPPATYGRYAYGTTYCEIVQYCMINIKVLINTCCTIVQQKIASVRGP